MIQYLKIAIPVALGLAAAALNYFSYQADHQPVRFVRVKHPVAAGDFLDSSNTEVCEIPLRHAGTMSGTFLAFEEAPALAKALPARRALGKHELLLKSDLIDLSREIKSQILYVQLRSALLPNALHVGQHVTFLCTVRGDSAMVGTVKELGPFRLARVGQMIRREDTTNDATNVIGIEEVTQQDDAKLYQDMLELKNVLAGFGEVHTFKTHPTKRGGV
jgi:hypothetical protein